MPVDFRIVFDKPVGTKNEVKITNIGDIQICGLFVKVQTIPVIDANKLSSLMGDAPQHVGQSINIKNREGLSKWCEGEPM